MGKEIWKDIPGYEGSYQDSTFGNIRSLDRFCRHPHKGSRRVRGRVLKKCNDAYGYEVVKLSVNNINPLVKVHRLISFTFLSNPENKPQVNHINGVKNDNHVDNLEWVTQEENIKHAYEKGLIPIVTGEKHHLYKRKNPHTSRKLIDTVTNEIYGSIKEAAKRMNMTTSRLRHMLYGNCKNITNLKYYNE